MAEPHRFFDVWLVDQNVVYREVPYTVVGDWAQEGRLLAADRVRPAGAADWQPLVQVPSLSIYLPRPTPYRAEDQAEALEPVEMGFSWKRPGAGEDEDVDMIPLIDISLVLLIFFMMSAGTLLTASLVETPSAESAEVIETGDSIRVTMRDAGGGQIEYFIGEKLDEPLSSVAVLSLLREELAKRNLSPGEAKVLVKASETLPYEKVQELTIGLERLGIKKIQAPVRDRPRKEGGG